MSTNDNPGVFAYVREISYRVRAYVCGIPYSQGMGAAPVWGGLGAQVRTGGGCPGGVVVVPWVVLTFTPIL